MNTTGVQKLQATPPHDSPTRNTTLANRHPGSPKEKATTWASAQSGIDLQILVTARDATAWRKAHKLGNQ